MQVVVQLGGLHQGPDLCANGGDLGRVQGSNRRVLVQQLLQPGQVAVGVSAGHRGHEVVDDRGVRPSFGLRPLPRVVHDERVDHRQVTEHSVRGAP